MRKLLLVLAFLLTLAAPAGALTAANSAGLTWTVTGTIFNAPGQAQSVPFQCSGAGNVTTSCFTDSIALKFSAPDATHIQMSFSSVPVCGVPSTPCQPGPDPASVDVSNLCLASGYAVNQSFTATFPLGCANCFGGTPPTIRVVWSASTTSCGYGGTPPAVVGGTLSQTSPAYIYMTSTAAVASLTGRLTYFHCFTQPELVSSISLYVATNTTNGALKECLYSVDGQTKVLDSTFTPSAGSGVKTNTVSPFLIFPGCYYVVVGCQTACNYQISGADSESPSTSTLYSGGSPAGKVVWHGTSTHVSGTCNVTLPIITGDTNLLIGLRWDQ